MKVSVARLALRVGVDPHFLSFALTEFAKSEGLDEAGLAAALGVPVDTLPGVRLCPCPRADPDGLRADLDRLCNRFGLNRGVLTTAVRHGHVVAAQLPADAAAAEADKAGLLLAARDGRP
jgi:hypothetical protein